MMLVACPRTSQTRDNVCLLSAFIWHKLLLRHFYRISTRGRWFLWMFSINPSHPRLQGPSFSLYHPSQCYPSICPWHFLASSCRLLPYSLIAIYWAEYKGKEVQDYNIHTQKKRTCLFMNNVCIEKTMTKLHRFRMIRDKKRVNQENRPKWRKGIRRGVLPWRHLNKFTPFVWAPPPIILIYKLIQSSFKTPQTLQLLIKLTKWLPCHDDVF